MAASSRCSAVVFIGRFAWRSGLQGKIKLAGALPAGQKRIRTNNGNTWEKDRVFERLYIVAPERNPPGTLPGACKKIVRAKLDAR
jgi:hypothetical protein